MKSSATAFTTIAFGGLLLLGCEHPGSGPVTPAGSPGTGTNVPMNNTPGLSGTGSMEPANLGTDTRTRTGDDTNAGVTGAGSAAPARTSDQVAPQPSARPEATPQPRNTNNPATRPSNTPSRPQGNEPTTQPPTSPQLPRSNAPTTAPTTR